MYKENLALNNQQWLIWHKTKLKEKNFDQFLHLIHIYNILLASWKKKD